MATGSELILGVAGFNDIKRLAKELELKVTFAPEGEEDYLGGTSLAPINKSLKRAHTACLKKLGFTDVMPVKTARGGLELTQANTPLGPRAFTPFTVELFYDPGEMGEKPEQAVLGVAISSRYYPRLADWKDSSGHLYPVVFDKELTDLLDLAKREILESVPELQDAVWIVKEMFY